MLVLRFKKLFVRRIAPPKPENFLSILGDGCVLGREEEAFGGTSVGVLTERLKPELDLLPRGVTFPPLPEPNGGDLGKLPFFD